MTAVPLPNPVGLEVAAVRCLRFFAGKPLFDEVALRPFLAENRRRLGRGGAAAYLRSIFAIRLRVALIVPADLPSSFAVSLPSVTAKCRYGLLARQKCAHVNRVSLPIDIIFGDCAGSLLVVLASCFRFNFPLEIAARR